MDDKKVIPFPMDKVKKKNGMASQNATPMSQKRRAMVTLSMASVFILATLWLERLNNSEKSRDLASAVVGPSRNLDEEMNLARRISRESVRGPASQGRKPNLEDKLRIEELAGRYAVNFEAGALVEIQYRPTQGEDPVYLNELDQFLMEHKELLRIPFHSVEHVETQKKSDGQTEIYRLVGDGSETKALVRFELDRPKRFHSMKVESRNRELSSE